MIRTNQWLLITVVTLSIQTGLFGQDLRIYTQIRSKVEGKPNNSQPFVRSLTLFHAGKVYDYVEPAQEIIVYEPALQRFTVLNEHRQLRSEVTQDEIRHFLNLAKSEAAKRLQGDGNRDNSKALQLLQFQLQPEFSVSFDEAKSQLSLSSSHVNYTVTTNVPPMTEIVENYLQVADWTAQLNSVLHPMSLLPGPRMALNKELRQRGMIPSSVELRIDTEPPIHLVAQHEWTWNLKEKDRQLIADWERMFRDGNYRELPFKKFQQEVLKSEASRRH